MPAPTRLGRERQSLETTRLEFAKVARSQLVPIRGDFSLLESPLEDIIAAGRLSRSTVFRIADVYPAIVEKALGLTVVG